MSDADVRRAPAGLEEAPNHASMRERYLSAADAPHTPRPSVAIDPAELPPPGSAALGGGLWQQVTDLRAALSEAQTELEAARKRAAEKELEARAQKEEDRARKEQAERDAAEVEQLRAACARLEAQAAGACVCL